jgi:hypothetical protein
MEVVRDRRGFRDLRAPMRSVRSTHHRISLRQCGWLASARAPHPPSERLPACGLPRTAGDAKHSLDVDRRSVVNGNIFDSKGVHVGVVMGDAVFGLKGKKLYDLKGSNIYKLNGDLVGHLSDARGKEKRLDKTTDKLFPEG